MRREAMQKARTLLLDGKKDFIDTVQERLT
jgi:hypothetical protein